MKENAYHGLKNRSNRSKKYRSSEKQKGRTKKISNYYDVWLLKSKIL